MDLNTHIPEEAKKAIQAATIEPLKGLGQAATNIVAQTVGMGGSDMNANQPSEEQIKQQDAQKLARARSALANFNAKMQEAYQQTERQEVEKKQVEEQDKQEDKIEDSQKKKAQAEALMQAKKGGGTEAGREVK